MEHDQWLERTTNGASEREVAKRSGISHTTLHGQIKRGRLSAESVISIAEEYGVHPITALIDTGYVGAKWAMQADVHEALREADDEDLAEEILRRMKRGTASRTLTTDVDQLEQARSKKRPSAFPDDGIVRDWDDSVPYAADSSPDEAEERWKRGEDPVD